MKGLRATALLPEVSSSALADYLRLEGWRPRGKVMRGVETWAAKGPGRGQAPSLLVPIDRTLADYEVLVERSLSMLAEFEQRPLDELIVDVLTPRSAILRLALEGGVVHDGGVALTAGAAMLNALTEVVRSAAAEALDGDEMPQPWQASVVERYVGSVRLGQTETGSYVMRALLPEHLEGVRADGQPANVPRTIGADLHRLAELASSPAPDFLEIAFSEWPFGRNVAYSLGRLADFDVSASFELSPPLRDKPREAEQFEFGPAALQTLAEAARSWQMALRETVAEQMLAPPPEAEEIEDFEFRGVVSRLARPAISLRGLFGDRIRTVSIARVTPDQYDVAYRAHGLERPVTVVGTLIVRPSGSLTFREVRSVATDPDA